MRHLVMLLVLSCSAAFAAEPFSATVEPHKMTLQTGDRVYTVGDDALIQPFGLRAQIVGTDAKGVGVWLTLKPMIEPKLVRDDARVKTVSGVWETTGGTPDYRLEMELEVQAGLPALTVRSRVRRVSEGGGDCYYYFGFGSQVTHYTVPGASAQEFQPTEWQVLPHAKWVYISQKKSGEGVGVISDGRIGRAPATGEGTAPGETGAFPYLICVPKTAALKKGESLDVTFTLLATKSADEVAALVGKLRALTGDRVVFDARPWPRTSLEAGHPSEARYALATGDGLAMSLSSAGQVADVSVGSKRLQPEGRTPLSGFFLRDHKARSAFTPVGGTITKRAGGLVQSGKALNVALNATYTQRADRIDISGELTDLTKTDRAISVYFALPVRNDRRWKWGDSIEQSRDVSPDEEYLTCAAEQPFPAGANGLNSLYPFASLSGPAEIAFGIPMDQPRVCRMTYCAETHQFFIVFDLALTEATASFPSKATFSFSIFTFAPDWGFRACAKKYYTMFPQFFEKRVKHDGGWVCWGNVADVPNYEELGYAYHWGLSGPEACKWDNDHGIYAFPYIEATNMHQTMEEFTTATSEDVVKRLQWIADPNRKEPLPAWGYDHPYATFLGDRDKALRRTAAAYLKSLIYDPQGHIYGSASKTEFNLLIAKYIPCDANPYMPGGIGEFFINEWLSKCLASMETKGGRTDGIAMDNFHCGDTALGRRREQFAWETIPLTFETSTGNPVLVKNFTTYEWTNEAAKRLRPQGKFIIANTCTAQFPFTFQLLDIHGWEWGIQGVAPFARTIAYDKPVCSLPVQDAHKEEAWVKWHLRYGFFPGGYANYQTMLNRPAMVKYVPVIKQLQAAGWEPVTGARSSDPKVTVERFGRESDGYAIITVYNTTDTDITTTIKFEVFRAHNDASTKVTEMLTGKSVSVTKDQIAVRIGGHDTQVYRVSR